jgi:hypothetical protein
MKEDELIMKKEKIRDLMFDVYEPELKFFDLDSDEMLDAKIEVLEALKSGKTIGEIPNFYDILELMPKDGIWD